MEKFLNVTKNFINFVKNNVFLIFAAYWFIDFLIGIITIDPSTLDATTRKIKVLELGLDLLWALVFMLEHTVITVVKHLSKRIELVEKEVDIIYNVINETVKLMASEEELAEEEDSTNSNEKTVEQE